MSVMLYLWTTLLTRSPLSSSFGARTYPSQSPHAVFLACRVPHLSHTWPLGEAPLCVKSSGQDDLTDSMLVFLPLRLLDFLWPKADAPSPTVWLRILESRNRVLLRRGRWSWSQAVYFPKCWIIPLTIAITRGFMMWFILKYMHRFCHSAVGASLVKASNSGRKTQWR